MNTIYLETYINAPVERCFKLATSIDLHKLSAYKTKEQAIEGVSTGSVRLGDTVTWRAKHFGFWHILKVEITEFKEPNLFVDQMVKGSFKTMKHTHIFEAFNAGVLMKDTFTFTSPLGILGKIVDRLFLKKYMKNFLIERNEIIKQFAESDNYKKVITSKDN